MDQSHRFYDRISESTLLLGIFHALLRLVLSSLNMPIRIRGLGMPRMHARAGKRYIHDHDAE
jgi:hypothetical protein